VWVQTHLTPQPPTIAAANEPEDGFPCHLPSAICLSFTRGTGEADGRGRLYF
jgi:hypothetical protein